MRSILVGTVMVSGLLVAALVADEKPAKPDDTGFEAIFDGKSLKGWHVSAKTGHSRASKNQSGGKWVIEDGAIVGSQDIPGNGGIVLTDKHYADFEVALEMNNDFGPDSGLFLRSTEDGKAYQAMIDYHANGNLMGIYGEGIGGFSSRNYSFLDKPDKIKETDAPFKLPVSPEKWPELWKHGQWNELRARITGNPPTIMTWINGVKFMDWTDKQKRHPDQGGIALQVHGGGDYTKQFVRYRKVRVKELPPAKGQALGDLEQWQGTWMMVSGERSGRKPPEETIRQTRITYKGDRYELRMGDFVVDKGKIRVDSSRRPKTYDLIPDNRELGVGIYEIDGDTMKTCNAPSSHDADRPKEFSGAKHGFFTWKRVKES